MNWSILKIPVTEGKNEITSYKVWSINVTVLLYHQTFNSDNKFDCYESLSETHYQIKIGCGAK